MTLISYPSLAILFLYVVFISDYSEKDIIFTSSEINPYTSPNEGIYLNNSESNGNVLKFLTYINDPNFDNDDNPYGKLRLHIYTNMDNLTDTTSDGKQPPFKDIEVPVGLCVNPLVVAWAPATTKKYCPFFNETHFLYGGLYSTKFAWMRLIIHECDDTLRGEELRR